MSATGAEIESRIGALVSHYRVLEALGGGAMGRVFRAEDTRLKRPVALKFLPARWSGDRRAKQRFIREARSASAIDHPNICTVYEIDETELGELFIVMPFYTGETLKKKISDGPLRWEEAVGYLEQSLAGLSKAHERGIVHRDIKPANMMITDDGVLKIVDFGLAKLAGDARVTGVGQAMGTVAYMSPEQTLGRELDARSDLWSSGVVLFEMLTGKCPFTGEPAVAMEAIRTADPPRLAESTRDVPPELERIVLRALTTSRRHRYQSATQMLRELRAMRHSARFADGATMEYSVSPRGSAWRAKPWAVMAAVIVVLIAAIAGLSIRRSATVTANRALPAPALDGRLRLGVLAPLVDATATAPKDWPRLIQALLATELTGVDEFGVVEPLTLNSLIERSFDTLQVDREAEFYERLQQADLDLALDGVLLGGEGPHVLIAKLVDLADREILFSTSLELDDARELSGRMYELAGELLDHIQVQALGRDKKNELKPWISTRRHDIDALRAFLRATEYIYRYQGGSAMYLERALEIDPDFIAARVWLISGLDDPDEARHHYEYLLGLEPTASPFEQSIIGWVGALLDNDLPGQILHLEIALDHSPDNYILLTNVADLRRQMGDCEQGLRDIEPALEARWPYPPLYGLLGQCLIELGRFNQAEASLEAALVFEPVYPTVYAMLEALAAVDGDMARADDYWQRYLSRTQSPQHELMPRELASVYLETGDHCLGQGRLECAVRLLSKAVSSNPEEPLSRQRLEEARDLHESRARGGSAGS